MRQKVAEQPSRATSATNAAGSRGAALSPAPYGIACVDSRPARAPGRAAQRGPGSLVIARQVADDTQSTAAPSEPAPAAPPLFATEHAGGISVVLGKGESLNTIARRYYGHQEKEWIDLLMAANGMTERDVSRLRPGRGILVPAVRRPSARPTPAARDVAPGQVGTVPAGQATFDAEGQEAPGRSTHSRRPHVPTDSSGVTLGRGYDMGTRRAGQIRSELAAAGVPAATASTYAQAARLTGADARAFAREHAQLELTPGQQWNLFVQEYQRIAATTQLDIIRWELSRPAEERVDPAGLDTTTAELLIDLRFRGDLTGRVWSMLRPHLNDTAALGQIVRQRSNFPRVPRDRYERRCLALGVEPEPEPAPARPVQRALAVPDALAGAPAPTIVHAALAAPSLPLAPALRQRMEAQLGHDFGHVHVHTGALADASARAVGALAYTVGEHVVFRDRAYAPDTAAGRQVLAHELVHVTQQPPLSAAGAANLVVGDPHAAEEREAQQLAPGPRAAPASSAGSQSSPTLRRQKADEAPTAVASAPTGVARDDVLTRMAQFTGLPYAFSEADTVRDLDAKLAALAKELQGLGKPAAGASAADKEQLAARKQQIDASVAAAQKELQKAKEQHADTRVIDAVRERGGPELAVELKEAVRQYGVVCNIYVELVMRTSGFGDFPVTGREYVPQTAKYRDLEAGVNKKQGIARSGWGLEWAERMVDWGAANGAVLYDDTDAARKTLPAVEAGDIVLFRRPNGRFHVSMVVADGDGFNFIGARSSGKSSGKSLTSPFKGYGDELSTRNGKKGLPQIMGQDRYMYILRPKFAARPPPPPTPAAAEE